MIPSAQAPPLELRPRSSASTCRRRPRCGLPPLPLRLGPDDHRRPCEHHEPAYPGEGLRGTHDPEGPPDGARQHGLHLQRQSDQQRVHEPQDGVEPCRGGGRGEEGRVDRRSELKIEQRRESRSAKLVKIKRSSSDRLRRVTQAAPCSRHSTPEQRGRRAGGRAGGGGGAPVCPTRPGTQARYHTTAAVGPWVRKRIAKRGERGWREAPSVSAAARVSDAAAVAVTCGRGGRRGRGRGRGKQVGKWDQARKRRAPFDFQKAWLQNPAHPACSAREEAEAAGWC